MPKKYSEIEEALQRHEDKHQFGQQSICGVLVLQNPYLGKKHANDGENESEYKRSSVCQRL